MKNLCSKLKMATLGGLLFSMFILLLKPAFAEDPTPPSPNLKLSIGGVLAIDETADPQVTSASGAGWSITQGFMNIYQLEIQNGTTLGYITGTGDGSISLNPSGGDVSIASNAGYSVNMDGHVNVMTEKSANVGNINLAGGIYTQGSVFVDDRDVAIGTSGSKSAKGVEASQISVGSGNLTINTTGTGLQYYNPTPGVDEGLAIESTAGHSLAVASSNIATANTLTATVSGGGTIDLTYTTSLGTFTSQASHWPWTDMTGTEEENPQPITVACVAGTDLINKYRMTTEGSNFLLESTGGILYQLGWNIPDSNDSTVTNGTVKVIAANGYRFTSGGYTDYSLEEGSTVTIQLLPDYGYQYVSGGLNGNQTSPEEGKGSYTFTMPGNNLHLSAIFEKTDDIISVGSRTITGATIDMPARDINGNAQLTIQDASNIDKTVFEKAAGASQIGSYLDMSLNEVINKGSKDEAWTTNITDLSTEMTVNLALATDLQGHASYSVLRNHDGAVTQVNSTYNASTNTLSFATDKYSSYAIAYSETNPDTSGGILKYQIIGLLSFIGLCGIIFYPRIRTRISRYRDTRTID